MRFKFKLLLFTISLLILPLSLQSGSYAATVQASQPAIMAKAAITVDAKTGQILYQKAATKPLAIASISKLMTVYIVQKQIKAGKLSWHDKVTISPSVAKLSETSGLTNVPLKSGHAYTVRQLVQAALIVSANAAAIALGQKIAGTPQKFAALMTKTATQLGITDAKFYNAAGLTNKLMGKLALKQVSANAENEMSASDVAILASRLTSSFKGVTAITQKSQLRFNGTVYAGHNELLANHQIAKGLRIDGLKTGTSDKAGACFAGSATYRGRRIVTVVLGARNSSASDPARFVQTAKMLKATIARYRPVKFRARHAVSGLKQAKVPDGKQTRVKLVTQKPIWVWVTKNRSVRTVNGKYVQEPKKLAAPVKTSRQVATANLLINHQQIKHLKSFSDTIPLIPSKSVKKANIFVRIWRAISSLF